MSSGGGSGSAPSTPISTTLPPISPIGPYMQQPTAGATLRYPLYATVQGGPLVYSPAMFGNIGMSWRPLGQVSTAGPSVNTSSPLLSASPLSQVPPGLLYPMLPMTKLKGGADSIKKSTDIGETGKRMIEYSHYEPDVKRPRLSESVPLTPSFTSSPSSHPSTPPHTHISSDQWSGQMQRSPVIKFISYPAGQSVILSSNASSTRTSTPQTIVLPITSLPKAVVPYSLSSPQVLPRRMVESSLSSEPGLVATSKTSPHIAATNQIPPPPLPDKLHLVLFRCLGNISDSVLNHPNITVSNQLHDLCKQSLNGMHDSLSPESVCYLVICYLNSLRPGEAINVENLRTMIHYAQAGEAEWIQYNKKHRKMSESTYVQSQLMHLSRMVVYPTQGKVQIRTSHHNLTDGLIHVLYHLQYSSTNLPDYVVAMALHTSATVDFCVLMIEPLQVLRLREAELAASFDSKRKRQQIKSKQVSLPQRPPSLKISPSNEFLSAVRRFERNLKDVVQIPFYCPETKDQQSTRLMSASIAESLVPASSYVIEHKPSGPFQEQYNMAVILLQKILSSFNSETKIEHFKNVDFRVLCPPDASFNSQTVSEVFKSGLVEYLEDLSLNKASGSPSNHNSSSRTNSDYETESRRRVVCCNMSQEAPQFQGLINDVQNNRETLYLVVVENAHLTTKIASKFFPSAGKSISSELSETSSVPISDSLSLLSNTTNCIILNVSSHPYSLQTSSCLIPPTTNQIHWLPSKSPTSDGETNGQFCSLHTFQRAHDNSGKEDAELGVAFKEDVCFEEMFYKSAARLNESSASSTSLTSLRAQQLLDQYIACLLAVVNQAPPTSCASPLPETLSLITQLVNGPMLNRRGQGSMLLIRSHDSDTGHQFYLSLKRVRNSLGLQFRFEVIFDNGSHLLSVSDHFAQRIPRKGRGQDGHVTCYKDLEGVPCIVVLAGQARAGLTFPRSLRWVDLRLCYPLTPFHRATYEYDLSLLNGYYTPLRKSSVRIGREDKDEPMKTEETDSVFNTTPSPQTPPNGPAHRTSSSSSSRKSSFCEETKQTTKGEGRVISWRPGATRTSSVSSTESHASTGNIEHPSPSSQECGLNSTGTVTVTIDPPSDENHFYSSTDSSTDFSKSPFTVPPVDEDMELHGDTADLDSDSDEEEGDEEMNHNKVCLLSRPYYHVWSSQNPQQHLLLPPAQGVTWSGGYKRTPLFDPDPHNQSLHYLRWSKPSSSHDRSHLDAVGKQTTQGAAKRFLLSGPPQVGKTGAWHMLIRLLHDHLRSSKGVTIETGTPVDSIFLQDTPSDHSTTHNMEHSKIVTLEYLTSHLCNRVDSKDVQCPSSVTMASQSTTKTPAVITVSTSPYMAYDVSHSCTKCSQLKASHGSEVLTSKFPVKEGSFITLKWQIPSSQAKHCTVVNDGERKYLYLLKLPHINWNKDIKLKVRSPVFIPTLGRDTTGLFNLGHAGYENLQVLVTVESQFKKYCRAWPNLVIMAVPDKEAMGLGATYHIIKSFAQHNYQLNSQHDNSSHTTWPMVTIMSDNIVMWKRIAETKSENFNMSEVLLTLERSTDCLQYAAIGVLTWSEDVTKSNNLSDFDLCHDFIMINLSRTAEIGYNQFSFNSAAVGFNLALREAGLKTKLCKEVAIVKKHILTGGNKYPLHSSVSSLVSDIDRVVISLHHDSSSHLPHPGPYLMEHYLLHKSQSLFPHALTPSHPVLVIDNYVTLGPKTHVTMVKSDRLAENSGVEQKITSCDASVQFGGLLLYLCEGRLRSEHISNLSFVSGACLCIVTRDCKTLVQEVARLDLEEKWKFRLRDEYQTACSDKMNPLFFFIGRYEG